LTSARLRRQWGEVKLNRTSRFIDELPPECLAVREPRRPSASEGRAAWPGRDGRPSSRPVPASLRRAPRSDWDEHDQRTSDDDEPVYRLDQPTGDPFQAGAPVQHEAFGRGRVVEARGAGDGRKLVIDFPGVGQKTVLARFV